MKLLVKRDIGSKGGVFGGAKPLFQMTLKLELSPEERAVVEKFGLQDSFTVSHPVESKQSFSYNDFIGGKTISDTAVSTLLASLTLYQSALELANSEIKSHLLFPGESVIEIA